MINKPYNYVIGVIVTVIMQIIEFLVSLTGAVLLLLYGIRMVKTGMERAYGRRLQRILSNANDNIPKAVFTGVIASSALQSSTAVNVLVANFASAGTIPLLSALAISLGADLGSAFVARFLALDLRLLIPLALCVGIGTFFRART
ncbi:MAG: Na/Pi symporter, partial [Pseudomonadota bacterium]